MGMKLNLLLVPCPRPGSHPCRHSTGTTHIPACLPTLFCGSPALLTQPWFPPGALRPKPTASRPSVHQNDSGHVKTLSPSAFTFISPLVSSISLPRSCPQQPALQRFGTQVQLQCSVRHQRGRSGGTRTNKRVHTGCELMHFVNTWCHTTLRSATLRFSHRCVHGCVSVDDVCRVQHVPWVFALGVPCAHSVRAGSGLSADGGFLRGLFPSACFDKQLARFHFSGYRRSGLKNDPGAAFRLWFCSRR